MWNQPPLKMREKAMDEFPIMEDKPGNIVLFHPHVPATAIDAVTKVLEIAVDRSRPVGRRVRAKVWRPLRR